MYTGEGPWYVNVWESAQCKGVYTLGKNISIFIESDQSDTNKGYMFNSKIDQSQMFDGRIALKGKMLLMAK